MNHTTAHTTDDAERLIAGTLPTDPAAEGYDLAGRWRMPEPLADAPAPPPPFPLEALPGWLGRYVASVSHVTQTPPDLAALLALSCLAVASAKRARVEVIPGVWSEPLNLYAVCAMSASERKSPVYNAMTRPIRLHQAAEAARLAPQIARAELDRRILEGRLTAAEKDAISLKNKIEQADARHRALALAEELADLPAATPPRLLADDVTPQKLATMLSQHGGRMAILSSEGDIFATIAGRWSGGSADMGVFLKGYSDALLLVDRSSRASEVIPWPALTIALTVQPSVVREIASSPEMRSRGLLARFLWAIPPSMVGRREVLRAPAAPEGADEYDAAIRALLEMPADPAADEDADRRLIPLSAAAAEHLHRFREMIEPRQRAYSDLADLADWAGKLPGNAARVMGLLHLAEHSRAAEPWTLPISGDTAAAALQIARWAIPHAEAALTPRHSQHDDAEHVLGWLLAQPADILTQSQIHKGARRRGWTVRDNLAPILQTLADRHWIRRYTPPKTGRAGRGRPAKRWQINPLARAVESR